MQGWANVSFLPIAGSIAFVGPTLICQRCTNVGISTLAQLAGAIPFEPTSACQCWANIMATVMPTVMPIANIKLLPVTVPTIANVGPT